MKKLLDGFDDDALARLMTNLGGHCMESLIDAFDSADDDKPTLFIAYTVKGYGLPVGRGSTRRIAALKPCSRR